MILVCALLFSCATDSSSDSAVNAGTPVIDGIETGTSLLGHQLEEYSIFTKWAAKYQISHEPVFDGVALIPDNSAFANIPADIKERKDLAESLKDQNRFLDAWKAYGDDDSEYIIALKTMDIVDTYTDTVMYQMFILSNLEPDQDLYEYRENYLQDGETVFWDPVEVIEAFVDENCDGVTPPVLDLALGCYYQSAALYLEDEWIMTVDSAYSISAEHFANAINAGVYNDYSLFKAVDAFMSAGYYDEAIEILHCLEMSDPEYCYHYYREALTYMYKGEYQNAMPAAAYAALLSATDEDVAASTNILANAFMYDSNDAETAIAVLDAGKTLSGDVYYRDTVFLKLDILMYAKYRNSGTDYDETIMQELTEAFSWEPEDDDYLFNLTDFFYSYGLYDIGIDWLTDVLPVWQDKPLSEGNLYFELGQLYMQKENWTDALSAFNNAESCLKEAGVFDMETSNIPYYQKECRERILSQPKKNKA